MIRYERYLDDPDIKKMPSELREIHAIRLMIFDDIKDMTDVERRAYFRQSDEIIQKLGLKIVQMK